VDNWKKITDSQNSVRKKSFGGTFSCSNCHLIGLYNGSLVLIVFGTNIIESYEVTRDFTGRNLNTPSIGYLSVCLFGGGKDINRLVRVDCHKPCIMQLGFRRSMEVLLLHPVWVCMWPQSL
jgi:hypothetical protein